MRGSGFDDAYSTDKLPAFDRSTDSFDGLDVVPSRRRSGWGQENGSSGGRFDNEDNLSFGGGSALGRGRTGRQLSLDAKAAQQQRKAKQAATALALQLKQSPAEQRAAVARQLDKALQNLFDVGTEMRETQIIDLEKRIQTLRTQLQERVEKKTGIIQLCRQTLVNEVNGLPLWQSLRLQCAHVCHWLRQCLDPSEHTGRASGAQSLSITETLLADSYSF